MEIPNFRYNDKIIPREDIERAMRNTKSNKAAARYLGVVPRTYKKYASFYLNEAGISLWETHKNEYGKGISKTWKTKRIAKSRIPDILEGRIDTFSMNHDEVKQMLIREGFLKEECYICEYKECRPLDGKMPLILNFLDHDKRNWKISNLELVCYNCFFKNVGDLFSKVQLRHLERDIIKKPKGAEIDLQIPERIKQMMNTPSFKEEVKEIIIEEKNKEVEEISEDINIDEKPDDFGLDLISKA